MAKLAHKKQSPFGGNQRLDENGETIAPRFKRGGKKWRGLNIQWSQRNLLMFAGGLLALAAVYGIFHQSRTCTGVEFIGTKASDLTQLRNLTPVKEGLAYADINEQAVADSIRRYPWVKNVSINERWNGVFTITIEERTPVSVILNNQGYPLYYLDRTGRQLPLSKNQTFDLPIVTGNVPRYKAGSWIAESSLRELGWALSQIDPQQQALASSFYIRNSGSIVMQSVAYGKSKPITVRLGLTDFKDRLQTFGAFWQQAVLPRPDKQFKLIDLRFDGQIVTRENV